MSGSTPSVPRAFDDERKTQDIVVRARGTFAAHRYDKTRSRAGLEGPAATAIALASGLGGRARPGSQFWPQLRGLSSSPASPPIPDPAVGGRFSDDGASGLSVVTGGAIPSHSGMSCSRCLQCGDVGSFPPPQSRTRSGQGRGSAPRHGVTLTARAVPRDRAPWRLHTPAPCRLEPRARLARASRL